MNTHSEKLRRDFSESIQVRRAFFDLASNADRRLVLVAQFIKQMRFYANMLREKEALEVRALILKYCDQYEMEITAPLQGKEVRLPSQAELSALTKSQPIHSIDAIGVQDGGKATIARTL